MCILSETLEQEIYWGHNNRLPYVHNERTHTKVVMNRLSHENNHNGKTHTKVVLNRLSHKHNYNERTHTKVEMNSHLKSAKPSVWKICYGLQNHILDFWWISIPVEYSEKFYIEKPNVLNVPSKYYRVSKPVPVSVMSVTIVEKDIYWGHTTRLPHRTHSGTLNSHFENADWWNPVFDFLEGIAVKPNVLTKFNFKYFSIQLLFTTRKKASLIKVIKLAFICIAFILLIMQAGDCEINPGSDPSLSSNDSCSKFPCLFCHNPCKWDQKAVQCDECQGWIHTVQYEILGNSNISWTCCSCGMPNFSTSLFS